MTIIKLDRWLFNKIYNLTANKIIKYMAVFIANYSKNIYFVMYFIGFAILCLMLPYSLVSTLKYASNSYFIVRKLVIYIAVPLLMLLINNVLRKIVKRKRPFINENVPQLIDHSASSSTPSNHATSSLVIAFAWLLICPRVGIILMILSFVTSLSRILVALHYPMDVLIGWIVAGVGGWLMLYLS